MEAPKRMDTSLNPKCSREPANLDWKSYSKMISHEISGAFCFMSGHKCHENSFLFYFIIFKFVQCQFGSWPRAKYSEWGDIERGEMTILESPESSVQILL